MRRTRGGSEEGEGEFAQVLVTSELHAPTRLVPPSSRWHSLAGPGLPPPARPARGPEESQSMLSVRSASARPVPAEQETGRAPTSVLVLVTVFSEIDF